MPKTNLQLEDAIAQLRKRTNRLLADFLFIDNRTQLAALETSQEAAYLIEDGREGIFVWDSSDLSAEVAVDIAQGIYVPISTDLTGASGAWVREYDGPLQARWFGIVDDGTTDNASTLLSMIALLGTSGGKIAFEGLSNQIAIASTIEIDESNIELVGIGNDKRHTGGTAGSQARTKFKWIGALNGTMFRFTSVAGVSEHKRRGGGFSKVWLNANALAGTGLEIASWNSGRFCEIGFNEFLISALTLDTISSIGLDENDTQDNYFGQLNFSQTVQTGTCVSLKGTNTPGNTSFNVFEVVTCIINNGVGWQFYNCDNNLIVQSRVIRAGGGTGNAVEFHGSNVNVAYIARHNLFDHFSTAAPVVHKGTASYTFPSYDNAVINLDPGNGTGLPTVETGSSAARMSLLDGKEWSTAITAAATCDFGLAATLTIQLSGGTTITSFGTAPYRIKLVRCTSVCTITHNATTLVLPNGQNITTAFNDMFIAVSDNSGNWRVYAYHRASGQPVVKTTSSNLLHGEDFVNAIQNGRFEEGDLGFTAKNGWEIINDSALAYSGNYLARFPAATSTGGIPINMTCDNYTACDAGDIIYAEALVKTDAGMVMSALALSLFWYDKDKTFIGSTVGTVYTTDQLTYVLSSVSASPIANAVFFRSGIGVNKTSGAVYCDNIVAYKKRVASKFLAGVGQGNAVLDFGAFPGTSDTLLAITGQTEILATSVVQVQITAEASADHTADEHWAESLAVTAGNIIAGTGFTIYLKYTGLGNTLAYGKFNVNWRWS